MATSTALFNGLIVLIIGFSSSAQVTITYSSSSNTSNVIKTFNKTENEPVLVEYTDGRIAQLVKKEYLTEFRTPITLSDNTCAPRRGIKCEFVLPLVGQIYSAIWKEHPTTKNKFLYRKTNRTEPDGTSKEELEYIGANALLSRSPKNAANFDAISLDSTGKKPDLTSKIYEGHIDCQSDITPFLPEKTQTITYWDENFEFSNNEISMDYQKDMSTNQMWRRYENLNFVTSAKQIQIESAKRVYGFISEFLPMGVTYQIQWSFLAPNLVDADNPLCKMKWDVDFTYIFNQFQKFQRETQLEFMKTEDFKPYTYKSSDAKSMRTQSFVSESTFTDSELK